MRKVDRSKVAVPKAFVGQDSAAARELAKAKDHVKRGRAAVLAGEKRPKSYGFSVYKDEAGKLALEALFHGKCAYCESHYASQAPVDVEHYRPKGGVEGDEDHWGYFWLAADWRNLLPSCIDCNRRRYQILATPTTASLVDLREAGKPIWQTGKENAFPVKGDTRAYGKEDDFEEQIAKERPFLLDPCVDDPEAHLEYLVDAPIPFGLVLPRKLSHVDADALPLVPGGADIDPGIVPPHVSARGAVTIQICGLNRLGLIQARTRVLRQLEALRIMIADADVLAEKLAKSRARAAREAVPVLNSLVDRMIDEVRQMGEPDQPFSAMVRQWSDRWIKELKAPNG
jgi:hypothetical protein